MYILGISCFYHDSAAALLHDGMVAAAAMEERFSRKKNDNGFPAQAIEFCLASAGIQAQDLDYVVFYEKPMIKFERILKTHLASFPRSWRSFGEAMITWLGDKLWVKSTIQAKVGVDANKILFVDHHMAHAASAFYASPFEEAAILTVDGVGEWTTMTKGVGRSSWDGSRPNEIVLSGEHRFPHSLGLLYSAFTAFLGFRVNSGEYKVMGMSPYGEPRYLDKIAKLFQVEDDGSFRVNLDYFSYHYSHEHTYNDKFVELFGKPRVHESDFFTPKTNPEVDPNSAKAKENQHYADIAASIQEVTKQTMMKLLRSLHQETGLSRLCMAGGVALNSKVNGDILAETPFKEMYIQPAAGDDGGALGAALYVYHTLLGRPRQFVMDHCYWGTEYGPAETQATLQRRGVKYELIEDESRLLDRVVDDILDGKVIALHQGRFEWGPRALGNRSIMADPRRAEMKEVVNTKIKFREPFRPFAPVILEEAAQDYFHLPVSDPERDFPSRFMLQVLNYREETGVNVPAVNHQGTGRPQTIRESWNPRYYGLVQRFCQATGIPVLMNTSFNLRGEPIVNTPDNALNTFYNSDIDTLVLGDYLVRKA